VCLDVLGGQRDYRGMALLAGFHGFVVPEVFLRFGDRKVVGRFGCVYPDITRRYDSALMPASLTCLRQRCTSPRMMAVSSSGVLPTGSEPSLRKRSSTSGDFSARTTSACSLATTAAGVRAGAARPYQLSTT